MEEFRSNSYKSKEQQKEAALPEKRASKVISGTAKTKQKSNITKFTDIFVAEDVSNVKTYLLRDVVVPAVKKLFSDVVTNGLDILLYGEAGTTKKSSPASKVSYTRYWDRSNNSSSSTSRPRAVYDYDNIVLDSRGEAEHVLMALDDIMDTYKMVRVADLYDLVGITGRHTDHNYGWTDITSAKIERGRDGYTIKLPRALPLE